MPMIVAETLAKRAANAHTRLQEATRTGVHPTMYAGD